MGLNHGPQNKKDLNVELNLLPVFDILSVCICFLLMTVVWVEVRALETKQGFGTVDTDSKTKEASIWITLDEKNNLSITMKSARGEETKSFIAHNNGKINLLDMGKVFSQAANLKATSTHILPAKTTKYDQVIKLMDMAKQAGINNIGLSPI